MNIHEYQGKELLKKYADLPHVLDTVAATQNKKQRLGAKLISRFFLAGKHE